MSSRLVFLSSWALFSVLAALWSLATPISASPDEPAHMIKAASVVRGQLLGEDSPDGSVVYVPRYVAFTQSQTCFARDPLKTADCAPAVPGDPAEIVQTATTAGRYSPVFYVLVGWPSLIFQDSSGIYAMRIVSGILASLFLAFSTMLIAGWKRRTLPLMALGFAVTPMVIFLNGSVNPNAVEITATMTAFVASLSIVRYPDAALLRQRAIIMIVAAALAANMRGISPLWVAAALLLPFLLASRQQIAELWSRRVVKLAVIVVGLAAVVGLVWTVLAGSVAAAVPGAKPEGGPAYVGASPWLGFFGMIAKTGDYLHEMVGNFGWLDSPAPIEAVLLWIIIIGSLVGWALVLARGAALRFTFGVIGAFVLLPAFAQAAYITSGGWIWQGRYTLPLLGVLLIGCAAVLSEYFDALAARTIRTLGLVFVITWSFGQAYSFASALHRYTIGATASWIDMLVAPHWAPPMGVVPTLLLFGIAIAVTGVVAYRFAFSTSPRLGLPRTAA